MAGIEHILLATDFRPASRRATEVATELGWAFGSRVSLLHALAPMPSWPVSLHQQRAWAESLLAGVRDTLVEGKVTVAHTLVEVGPPASTIVHQADVLNADLIIVGSGDRRGFGVYACLAP